MADELVGITEIAKLARVSRQAVANWRARFPDFPDPVAELRSGPVFRGSQVRKWLRSRRVSMAYVISTINLKGGVAKTTTTVAIAEVLSSDFHKRVLVIDLDPQTNATALLIGDERWGVLNEQDHTLARLFKDALLPPSERSFDLDETLQRRVSSVASVRTVDLLPSSLELIDIQDQLGAMPSGRFYAITPTDILGRAVRPILDDYDYVLIDCPPNMGIVTLNGLKISDGYIIPVIPDYLSTYGIPQIESRVAEFSREIGEAIKPIGIVISKYREQAILHKTTVNRLRERATQVEGSTRVFETVIPEASDITNSAEFKNGSTMTQKYGSRFYSLFQKLTKEILTAVEG